MAIGLGDDLSIAAILVPSAVSLAALIFSIIAFKRTQRFKRIENYLQFGAPSEIQKRVDYLKEKKERQTEDTNREYAKRKRAAIDELAGRGLARGGIADKTLEELEQERKRRIDAIERDMDHKIQVLEQRREYLFEL